MSHQIRTSARRSFRSCRRRWQWAYVEGYVPLEEPKPLEFGRAFHCAMEEIYNPETWDLTTPAQKLELAKHVFELECEKQRNQYLTAMGATRLDKDGQNDYDERIKLGHGMLEYYIWNVHVKDDGWLRPVKVEIEFDVPVTTESGKFMYCNNSPKCGQSHYGGDDDDIITYGGRVDAIVEDIVRGGYYAIDWKTAGELRANDELLENDDQLKSYSWALREKLGIDIRGFIYVEIRKAYPQPPARLKRSRNGCAFSTDKRMPTTAAVYREVVSVEDAKAFASGCYDEFLDYLENDKNAAKFHQRFTIIKTPTQLLEAGKDIALEAADMIQTGLRIYPSFGRFSCPSCAFKSPCTMKSNGEDYLYTLDTLFRKVAK